MSNTTSNQSSKPETLIDSIYSGSGDKEDKESAANAVNKSIPQKKIQDESNTDVKWRKPMVEVYDDFNHWIDGWATVMDRRKSEGPTTLGYDWYKSGSDITILDRDKYRNKLFDTTKIQDAYKEYLTSTTKGVNGDPIGIKLQSGCIMADERAFYIRHATIPRLMSTGLMQNMQYNFLKSVYLNRIEKLREFEDNNYKKFHENRYKNDAEGVNKKHNS